MKELIFLKYWLTKNEYQHLFPKNLIKLNANKTNNQQLISNNDNNKTKMKQYIFYLRVQKIMKYTMGGRGCALELKYCTSIYEMPLLYLSLSQIILFFNVSSLRWNA